MFAHGFGCDQSMWRYMTPAFEAVAPDCAVRSRRFRPAPTSPPTTGPEVRNARRLRHGRPGDLRRTGSGPDVVFVGHSVSAMIGVLAAEAASHSVSRRWCWWALRHATSTTASTPAGFRARTSTNCCNSLDSNYLGWSAAMAPAIMGNPDRPELGQELANSFCRTDPEIAGHFARVTFLSDNREDLSAVHGSDPDSAMLGRHHCADRRR